MAIWVNRLYGYRSKSPMFNLIHFKSTIVNILHFYRVEMSDTENGEEISSKPNCTFTFKRRNRGRGGASLQVINFQIQHRFFYQLISILGRKKSVIYALLKELWTRI